MEKGVTLKSVNQLNGDTYGANGEPHGANGEPHGANGDIEVTTVTTTKAVAAPTVGIFKLYRFATRCDWLLIIIGIFVAVANGIAMPAMIIFFGKMINEFVKYNDEATMIEATTGNITSGAKIEDFQEVLLSNMKLYALYFVGLGVGIWIVSYGQMVCWGLSAERQCHTIRLRLFHTILRQDIGWFDTHDIGELNTRLSDDINKIKEGLGEKIGAFLQYASMAITGFIIGFIYGWKLTLVILSVSPLMAIGAFIMTKLLADLTSREQKAYAQAGSVAEEVLGSIKTVAAFGGQVKEKDRYSGFLTQAYDKGVKKGLITGTGMGFVWFVMLGAYGLAFYYGGILIRGEDGVNYDAGAVLIVFFSVIFGAFSIGTALPNLQSMSTGMGAAYSVFSIIDTISAIDSFSEEGQKPENYSGNLSLNNIHFFYPSRPSVKVLDGLSLNINVGEKVALVGSSGCGKSTVMQLLQRFYDPTNGNVTFDGIDIKNINTRWLREKIGVVSQEPVLFGTTIAENLRFGRLDVSPEEMEAAARQANAYDFIMDLPEKFETLVGERGAQLSGGQKQRIAIARALVRNPTILLLDEATSALDNESEAIVQEALEKASEGRTTIIIAHRLSTIRGADRIMAISNGRVVEQGTHDQLMTNEDGVYSRLVKAQVSGEMDDEDFDEVDLQVTETDSDTRKLQRLVSTTSIGSDEVSSPTHATPLKDKKEEKAAGPDMKRVYKMNSPEVCYIIVASIAALMNGAVQPCFALILSEALFVFKDEYKINAYCLGFLGMAVLSFITFYLQCHFK